MGDRLGTLGAVGFAFFLTFNFFLLFCTKIHHTPNPSAVGFLILFFMEFAASNLFDDFDDSPTNRFEISKKE